MAELDPRITSIIGSTRLDGGDLDDATSAALEQIVRAELGADNVVGAALARYGIALLIG